MGVHVENGQRRATWPEDVKELTQTEVLAQLNASAASWGEKQLSDRMLAPQYEASLRRALRGLLKEDDWTR